MQPKELKEPTKCCASPTLLWIKEKTYYACPCGQTKINLNGRPVGKPFMFIKNGPKRVSEN